MDLRRNGLVAVLAFLVLLVVNGVEEGNSNVVFRVQHKFRGRRHGRGEAMLAAIKAHDSRRHGRMLAAVDMPLGGNGSPTDAALYFTKLSIGTPPKDYYVQVDTGSDILWVTCAGCERCPRKALLVDLRLYDLKDSSTGRSVSCDQDFCTATFNAVSSDCKAGMLCEYSVTYGDGSTTAGYFVRDNIKLDQVTGNLQTTSMNGSIAFGCSAQQSGEIGSSSTDSVDGIVGFGQANSSIISQLASAGKVKRVFSHCLDGINGGGVFAIGQVVQPKLKTTPMVPNEPHYNVIMKAIEIGGNVLDVPTDAFGDGSGGGTIIDSGTTLAYLPKDIYAPFLRRILAAQPNLQTHIVETEFKCFFYPGNIDDGFPVVTFHFEDSLPLTVYPHEYLFEVRDNEWCIGWMNKGMQTRDGREITLLGDLVLSNKLVMYDLENQTIGWAEYNCSSSIKLKDEKSGNVYSVGAHIISSADSQNGGLFLAFLLFFAIICNLID